MEDISAPREAASVHAEGTSTSEPHELLADARLQAKSSTVVKAASKVTARAAQMIKDYTKAYRDYQDVLKDNGKLQNGIAHYFRDHLTQENANAQSKKNKHHTKEENERHAQEIELEHQKRFESNFKVVKDLNKKIAIAIEDARRTGDAIQKSAADAEKAACEEWKAYCARQKQVAGASVTRTGESLDAAVFDEHISRADAKLKEWRVAGLKGAHIWMKRKNLEESLRALDNFGGDYSLNYYEELKALGRHHQERNDESLRELEQARVKQAHASQIAAHLSEKVSYLSILEDELKDRIGDIDQELINVRENLNKSKMHRDRQRKIRQEIKAKSGLMYAV